MAGMNKLPPLIELRAFDAAARHLSFKKAAAELGVTPTAISHQIRLLERYCGRALFRRRPRPLTLTEAGARLFPVIRDGLEAFATAIAAVKREGDTAAASRDDDKCLCEPVARATPAPLEEGASQCAARGDRHRQRARPARRRCRRRHSLCAARSPTDGIAEELLSDTFWPVCNPELLSLGPEASRRPRGAGSRFIAIGRRPTCEAPTWQRWLAARERRWRDVPEFKDMEHLSFREELHAIEAVIAGQGIGIFSDVLVARELAAGTLVKAFDLSLPGYRFYVVRTAWSSTREDHPSLCHMVAVSRINASLLLRVCHTSVPGQKRSSWP